MNSSRLWTVLFLPGVKFNKTFTSVIYKYSYCFGTLVNYTCKGFIKLIPDLHISLMFIFL